MSCPAADIFHQAARLNRQDPRREGNVVSLEGELEVLVTGDIHGHRANLNKILSHAAFATNPHRRVVLQEIVHGPIDPRTGQDRSVDLLLRAARAKVSHGEQVIFLLANHDVAQATGNEISKNGLGVCKTFEAGVRHAFEDDAEDVIAAINDFLLSAPLAVRCPNGVLISHSLPGPSRECDIPENPYLPDDFRRGGAVYEWTWGRGHNQEHLEKLAARLGVEFFVISHVHLETGWQAIGQKGVIVACDNEHACVFRFTSDQPIDQASLERYVQPVVAMRAP